MIFEDHRKVRIPDESDRDSNEMPAAVVTFALSPEDAKTLMLAREVGPLSLALRKTGDFRRIYRPLGLVPIP